MIDALINVESILGKFIWKLINFLKYKSLNCTLKTAIFEQIFFEQKSAYLTMTVEKYCAINNSRSSNLLENALTVKFSFSLLFSDKKPASNVYGIPRASNV